MRTTRSRRGRVLLLSCEHAGRQVPACYAHLFSGGAARRALASHRGYDPGALRVGRFLARFWSLPLYAHLITRLLVEPNRSPHHPQLFSEFSRRLGRKARGELLARHYHPHRVRVQHAVQDAVGTGQQVIHIAVHSFTPVLDGKERRADVAFLYDPRYGSEADVARQLQRSLKQQLPGWWVRRNYPYRGAADGLTTTLRRCFSPETYVGLELELNQRWLDPPPAELLRGLAVAIDGLGLLNVQRPAPRHRGDRARPLDL